MVSFPPSRHGVAGVDGKVDQDLLDLARIRLDHGGTLGGNGQEIHVLADQASEHIVQPFHQGIHVEDPWLERLLAAEGEELPRQRGGPLGAAVDLGQAPGNGVVGVQAALQHLAVAPLHHQDVVEIMGHSAGQPADGLHLLRLQKLRLEVFPFPFGLLAGRRVAHKDQVRVTALETHRHRGGLHREPRAVQAQELLLQGWHRPSCFALHGDTGADRFMVFGRDPRHHLGSEKVFGPLGSDQRSIAGLRNRNRSSL